MTDLAKEQIEALLDGTTEGPWVKEDAFGVRGADDNYVANFGFGPDTDEGDAVAERNAALGAAAPDLARTCLSLYQRVEDAEAAQALTVERAVAAVPGRMLPLRGVHPGRRSEGDTGDDATGASGMTPKQEIAEAAKDLDAAQAAFDAIVERVQSECDHSTILVSSNWGEDWRRCLLCGLTETTPCYHSFYFDALKGVGATMLPVGWSTFQENQVEGARVRKSPGQRDATPKETPNGTE